MHFISRISYNTSGWQHPTGEAGTLEGKKSFNALHGFGFEDWLFRGDWLLDGWRYAFIQGANKQGHKYEGSPLNLTLYTVEPDKRRRFVANIYELECLSAQQSLEALGQFREHGWLQQMEREIVAANGKSSALYDTDYTLNILNVRFPMANVDWFPPDTIIPANDWLNDRHRYMLYRLDGEDRKQFETLLRTPGGRQTALAAKPVFRKGTAPVVCSPEHRRMQAKLLAQLQAEHGADRVHIEVDGIDVLVETSDEIRLYEIKSDLNPRAVIRQALGQILEYAYHPPRTHRLLVRLVIVGRCDLGAEELAYLAHLKTKFGLPLDYLVVTL